jgi:hypothetical protein
MNRKPGNIFSIISFALLTACTIYQPQLTDIPLISHQNDLRIDGSFSTNLSTQATLSYGVTNNLALQTFGSIGSDHKYYVQGAIGYYNPIDKNTIIELYGGVGFGYGSVYRDANPGNLYGPFQLYFSQINIGRVQDKFAHIDYGLGIKAGLFNSYFTDRNYYDFYSEGGPFTTYHDHSFLFEPMLFARLGGERLKLSFKLGLCFINQFSEYEKRLPYSHYNLGIGLNYLLKK